MSRTRVDAAGEHTSLHDRKRRAGARLILGFEGTSPSPEFKRFVARCKPAGFCLFSRNIEEPAQVLELNRELASMASPDMPAFLSVDQEGGRVQRIRSTQWPRAMSLGNLDDLELTAQVHRALALELRAMGFNTNWSPVADINSNPRNPVIGDRSFGDREDKVSRHVVAALRAQQDEGIIACAKHFPGHGDTSVDSHKDLPVVDKDPYDLEHLELVPFKAAVEAGVGAVMASHVMFPALDEKYPTTMSPAILQGWLRKKMGYQGVLTSDDMEMKAVADRYPLELQLDLACRATIDVFLFCRDLDLQVAAWETLVRLQEQEAAHDHLSGASVRRLMQLRMRFFRHAPARPPLSVVGSLEHKALAQLAEARGHS